MCFVEQMFSLRGQVAAVVGGGGVLAGAMAKGLAKAGADIAILDLNLENAQKMADSMKEFGVKSIAIQMNATSKSDLANAAQQISDTLGSASILVNAPGINSTTPFFEITEDEFDKIMAVNLKSMVLACQVFGEKMINEGTLGSIINISSASSGPPLSKVFTYSVSKAGVNNLTQ